MTGQASLPVNPGVADTRDCGLPRQHLRRIRQGPKADPAPSGCQEKRTMIAEGLKPGLMHRRSLVVDRSVIVPALPPLLGSMEDMPPVLATACMVAFVETTCIEALGPYLAAGQKTVGTH